MRIMDLIKPQQKGGKNLKKEEDKVSVSQESEAKKYSLEELLEKVRPENIHEEIDMGKPRGKEVW